MDFRTSYLKNSREIFQAIKLACPGKVPIAVRPDDTSMSVWVTYEDGDVEQIGVEYTGDGMLLKLPKGTGTGEGSFARPFQARGQARAERRRGDGDEQQQSQGQGDQQSQQQGSGGGDGQGEGESDGPMSNDDRWAMAEARAGELLASGRESGFCDVNLHANHNDGCLRPKQVLLRKTWWDVDTQRIGWHPLLCLECAQTEVARLGIEILDAD